jgi:hypothetical protein
MRNTAKDSPCQSQAKLSRYIDGKSHNNFFFAGVIVTPERSNFSFDLFDGPQNIVTVSYARYVTT